MQQLKYLTSLDFDSIKENVELLFKKKQPVVVTFKKPKANIESYEATIQGVYKKFFTVKAVKLKSVFTIQFFEIISGAASISITNEKEG